MEDCCKKKNEKETHDKEVKTHEENNLLVNKNVVIVASIAFVILFVFAVYMIVKPNPIQNTQNSGNTNTGMDSQGFNSYEEMMEAHHGGSEASTGVGGCGQEPAPHDSAIVGTGEKSNYDVTYDQAGYNLLLGYAKSVNLNSEQTKKIVGLNAEIPCCGFKTLQAEGNCECGHHVALYGLAKLLASKNYSRENIQMEMDKWKQIFYPNGNPGTGGC